MVFPKETIASGASPLCSDCGMQFQYEILKSPAGYYVGTTCRNDDCVSFSCPNSRDSDYYRTKVLAEQALADGSFWR